MPPLLFPLFAPDGKACGGGRDHQHHRPGTGQPDGQLLQAVYKIGPALCKGCTDAAQDLPVLRPCIGMDKIEIINISRKIGTFETSIEPYEDCCTIFTPPHPKTKPSLAEIEAAEAGMPGLAELERIAAETVEKIPIRIGDDPEF